MHPRQQSSMAWKRIRQDEQARTRDAAHRIPSRWAGGVAPATIPWLRIDGGRTLNASPLVTGVDVASSLTPSNAGPLTPGTVDPVTGVETAAPTGAFGQGFGYGTLRLDGGPASRVLIVHPILGFYRFSLISGTVWVATKTSATINGVATECWQVVAP